jgi:hypothetical protein
MLKILFIVLLFFNSIYIKPYNINVFADNSFARADKTTYLYKSTSEDNSIDNIYCIIEKSYFVEIKDSVGDFYSVNYNNASGFVKKNDVEEIIDTPQTPYPNNIKIIIGNNCNLRSSPTTNSTINNVIATIRSEESNITFIGKIFSEEAIDFGGTTWYYVKYNDNYGYIYNKYVKSITPIFENTEKVSYKSKINSNLENPITNTPSLIIVIILFIPCIFVLIIIYYPNKKYIKTKKTRNIEKL